jgi:hypothetical protein
MESKLTIDKYGHKYWYNTNGERHREGGPAFEYIGVAKSWYLNGELHREDGPAVEHIDGYRGWYINGKEYTEQEYKYKTRSRKLKKLL